MIKNAAFCLLLVLVGITGCDFKYEAPVPDLTWAEYDAPSAVRMTRTARKAMEGVYKVSDGADYFGGLVALKWSYTTANPDTTYKLSIFCGKDIAYFTCEGKRRDGTLLFDGYWRKLMNVETGISRFTITDVNGAAELLSSSPHIESGGIRIEGVWGHRSNAPEFPIVLTYERPLHDGSPFEILGHRGGGRTSDHLPASENSLGMIKYATQLGATGVEIDVRLTADGVPILYHDNTLNLRLINKTGLVGPIDNYSFQQLNTFVTLIDGEHIPTLRDALDAVLNRTELRFVWLDIKFEGSLELIRQIQKEYLAKADQIGRDLQILIGLPEESQVASFLALPDYPSAPSLCELSIDDVQRTHSAVWAPRWTLGLQTAEVAQIHSEGRKAFVWTLDDPPFVEQYIREGSFDGILTNYPTIVAYYYYVGE